MPSAYILITFFRSTFRYVTFRRCGRCPELRKNFKGCVGFSLEMIERACTVNYIPVAHFGFASNLARNIHLDVLRLKIVPDPYCGTIGDYADMDSLLTLKILDSACLSNLCFWV